MDKIMDGSNTFKTLALGNTCAQNEWLPKLFTPTMICYCSGNSICPLHGINCAHVVCWYGG